MLIGARTAGFKIIGNIEWRNYYHCKDDQGRNTFTENFPGAFLISSMDELDQGKIDTLQGIDLAMGHPNCGLYSPLTRSNYRREIIDPGDLPLFVEMIQRIRPRFFVMDNLPRSLIAYSIEQWAQVLHEYDLFPEWISNYNYGNVQKRMNRFFMIGARKEESFVFIPGEYPSGTCLIDTIGDLPLTDNIVEINHLHRSPHDILPGWKHYYIAERGENRSVTLAEFQDYIKDHPCGIIPYYSPSGGIKRRIGQNKISLARPARVVTGGGWQGVDNHFREDTLSPLTLRERARIQGCPDDFIFYPLQPNRRVDGYLTKQVGKFMPVQFCEYVSRQIMAHIRKIPFECSEKRLIRPNEYIDQAKRWYCENVGYGVNQDRVCERCWIRKCSIRRSIF
jgi:site-specific DNA-cytosine methylase